jgi:hypothetical protein
MIESCFRNLGTPCHTRHVEHKCDPTLTLLLCYQPLHNAHYPLPSVFPANTYLTSICTLSTFSPFSKSDLPVIFHLFKSPTLNPVQLLTLHSSTFPGSAFPIAVDSPNPSKNPHPSQ